MALKLEGWSVRSLGRWGIALGLSIVIAACSGPTAGETAVQTDLSPKPSVAVEKLDKEARSESLPPSLGAALRQDLGKRIGIAPEQIRVVKATRQTWPDGCLGLGRADELCTQALVEGWRGVLSAVDRPGEWVYRTDRSGQSYRLEAR